MTDKELITKLSLSAAKKRTIAQLRLWNDSMTLKENGKRLGIPEGQAHSFAERYQMRWKRIVPFYRHPPIDHGYPK